MRQSPEFTVEYFMRIVHLFLLGIIVSTGSLPWKLSRTCDVTKFSFFSNSLWQRSLLNTWVVLDEEGGHIYFFSFFETGNMLNKLLPLPRSSNHRRRTVELTASKNIVV